MSPETPLERAPARARIDRHRFDRQYAQSSDPWDYLASSYESEKRAATLAALPSDRFAWALEVGCSLGVLTSELARRCERVVAIDFSPRALALAQPRVGHLANVKLVHASFPEEVPLGTWDLVVCSEVLYYLDRPALLAATRWLEAQLRGGACVLAVSWRGRGVDEPFTGDAVHDHLCAELEQWHGLDGRRPGYRLDRFDGDREYERGRSPIRAHEPTP